MEVEGTMVKSGSAAQRGVKVKCAGEEKSSRDEKGPEWPVYTVCCGRLIVWTAAVESWRRMGALDGSETAGAIATSRYLCIPIYRILH
jgi:hypothetical protein